MSGYQYPDDPFSFGTTDYLQRKLDNIKKEDKIKAEKGEKKNDA